VPQNAKVIWRFSGLLFSGWILGTPRVSTKKCPLRNLLTLCQLLQKKTGQHPEGARPAAVLWMGGGELLKAPKVCETNHPQRANEKR